MDRQKTLIERIHKQLAEDGYVKNDIHAQVKYGIGNARSYFDALVDIKLEGLDYPKAQDVWEEMKMQINYLTKSLLKASRDYDILQAKCRGLEEDIRDLRK
jgi:hypothetical protein